MATKKKSAKKASKKQFDFFTWLRSGLRKISRRYPPIYEALAAAKVPYKGSNARQKFAYICACCGGEFSAKEVAVDHRTDCGALTSWSDVQGFMERLFCGKEGLDVLCHTCHDCKSYMTKNGITWEEAIAAKAAIAYIKTHSKQEILDLLQSHGYNGETVSNAEKRRNLLEQIFLKEQTNAS